MAVSVEVKRFADLSDAERRAVSELGGGDTIDEARFAGFRWAPADWQVLLRLDGEIASGIKIVERVIDAGGVGVRVGGIGDVATLPHWRRRGLASAAMRRAGEFICTELEVGFGVLFCDDYLVPFYGRLGWQLVEGPTWVEIPRGRVAFPEPTMVLPCRGGRFPTGERDLRGLPW